jgi:hypothetical protein
MPIRNIKANYKTNGISLGFIHKMNLLNLINLWLAHIYYSITWANYELIKYNRFVSRISLEVMEFILSLVYI